MKIKTILVLFLATIFIFGCQQKKSQTQKARPGNMIKKEKWGNVDGKDISLFTITNQNGIIIKLCNYGGIITSISTPNKEGRLDDIVLGYDKLDDYIKEHPYFGAIVGRYANRIAKGKFILDSDRYELAVNNGINHLHGGIKAFDKMIWDAIEFKNSKEAGIELSYISADGEEGYPGNLVVKVTYSLTNENELIIKYHATTDKATPVNLTHHSYFNLTGSMDQDILNHNLWINADRYTPVDSMLIPTGTFEDVTNTPMDFRKKTIIGKRIEQVEGGYDHSYVLNGGSELKKAAELSEKSTGRKIEVFTTEPGMQFYTGNFLDGSLIGKNEIIYKKHCGLCLETQHFPDSPNQPKFPNTILRPGEIFSSKTVYKFGIIEN